MKIISDKSKEMNAKRAEKLKGLLYLKGMQEHQIKVAKAGADICCAFSEALDKKINSLPADSLECLRLKFEQIEATRVARDFVSDFKELKNQYEHGTVGDIRETAEKEQFEQTEFFELNVMAQELVKYELYGKVVAEAENVEHPKVIKDIEYQIDLINQLIAASKKELAENKALSDLEKVRLHKSIFENSIYGQTLQKRLNKRKEYYYEQFLPVYEKDMAECALNLDRYLSIAKEVVETGIDPAVQVLLDQYNLHKNEQENLWLFYTALRGRLNDISKYVLRNKNKFPKIVKCLQEFN